MVNPVEQNLVIMKYNQNHSAISRIALSATYDRPLFRPQRA
jgi:hypothetical protein